MSHIQTGPGRCLIASIAFLAMTACGGNSSGPGAPDDPGVLLASNVVGSDDLVWTRDGSEVVYATATSLNAVTVATRVERHLVTDAAISIKAIGSAGDRIYYGAVITPAPPAAANFRVSRVNPTTGVVEILISIPWRGGEYIFVSADERFVVADGRIYNLQAGTQIDLACNRIRGFSPDATRLLCQGPFGSGTQAPFALISTADGTSQQLTATTALGLYFGHRWEGNSPQLLDFASDNGITTIYEINGVTGTTRDVGKLDAKVSLLLLAGWSPDSRTLGAWIDPTGGREGKANLYVFRTGSAPATAARVRSTFFVGPNNPVFSDTGNSVAYFYNGENNSRSLYAKTGI
jgi:hypothetical protein